LALAGLIPSIQRGELPASAKWPLVRCRPGTRPWENLQIALSTNQQIALRTAALPALIIRPEDEQRRLHLTTQLALHDQPENHRLFILIDQFEEIFTLCNEEGARRELIDNVLYATNVAGGRTIVVLTMRADFYGQCASYPGLRAAIADHQSLIGPLSEEELREAIESPAQLAGGELEPGLMELLLADMKGQAGALPFLEHALFKLWEMRDGRRLTARAYTEMGRLGGALDAHAEEFFTKTLSVEEQSLCRQLLVDLVHPGEGAADTKKRVSLDDVAPTDAVRAVLKKLADARLVTTDRDDRPEAAQAELAHEALISGWRRLGEWVNENREKSRLKERLLDSGREWQKSSKKEDFLYRGAQLATAQEIFGSSEELPKIGREFLEASIAARKRAQQEKQREQRGRQRLLAAASAVFALLAVAASAAAIFGFWQKGEAGKQAKHAEEAASQANVLLAFNSKAMGNYNQEFAYLAKALRLNRINSEAGALTAALLTQERWPVVTGAIKHDGAVIFAQFSPDGQRVVTASTDQTARVWDAATGKALSEPMKHDGAVYSAQFSPDGQRVVTASTDQTARVWDAATGKALSEPMKHDGWVNSAQFSPDGQRVVTASSDKTARVWDVLTITRKDSADDANLLADLVEATGGLALQAFGQTEILTTLTPGQVIARRDKIAAKFQGASSELTPLQRFLKWSVSGARTRTISPFSDLTVADWLKNRIKEGTLNDLRAAMLLDPANARLAANFGMALANLAVAEKTDPDEARRARAEADYQTHRAVKLAPDNDEVKKLRADVVKLLNLPSDPK